MLSYYPSFFELPTPEAPVTDDEVAQKEGAALETEKMENAKIDIENARNSEQQ